MNPYLYKKGFVYTEVNTQVLVRMYTHMYVRLYLPRVLQIDGNSYLETR